MACPPWKRPSRATFFTIFFAGVSVTFFYAHDALQPDFKAYQQQVVKNSKTLSRLSLSSAHWQASAVVPLLAALLRAALLWGLT